jgi:thiol-disulfide isomerase/thioredoxin
MHSLLLVVALSAPAAAATPYQGVLLEFSASWCRPCQKMSPLVTRLQRQGFPIRKVDVDREKALTRRYGIGPIPAFVLVINGKEVSRSVGLQSETDLKRMMAKIPREKPRREVFVPAFISKSDERTPVRSAGSTPAVAGNRTKPGFLSRIKLPLFGSKSEPARRGPVDETPAVIRGKYETPRGGTEQIARIDPLASSTRIRIKDGQGVNYGSGTIIDSRPGRTVVLTCGHIFRDLSDESSVEVDVFNGDQVETYVGKVLRFDLKSDVGLITIASDVSLSKSLLAAIDVRQLPNDRVFSIGCGGGDNPTRQDIRVTRLNPYLGPHNLECTGVPIQGRSGGGLFNEKGEVIGVCFAADPNRQCGLYAGLKAIHALLNNDPKPASVATPARVAQQDAINENIDRSRDIDIAALAAAESDTVTGGASVKSAAATQPLAIAANAPRSAEVICIIRSHDDPRATSRVVIINRASPEFLAYLKGELAKQPQPTIARKTLSGNEPATTRRTSSAAPRRATPMRYRRSAASRR